MTNEQLVEKVLGKCNAHPIKCLCEQCREYEIYSKRLKDALTSGLLVSGDKYEELRRKINEKM